MMTEDAGVAAMRRYQAELDAMTLPATLGDFLRARAAALGDTPLGVWFEEGVTLTYRQLDERADRLAASLLTLGARKGAHVAVMLRGSPDWLAAWFAIARLGAVIVPVNTGYTATELAYVLGHADAQFLLVESDLLGTVNAMPSRPPLLADERIVLRGDAVEPHPSFQALIETGAMPFAAPYAVTAADLVSLQYTSGTTGFPKGCMLTHEYWILFSHTAWLLRRKLGISRTLIWQPMFYMDGEWNLLFAMCLGATVYFCSKMSLTRFCGWLRDHEIHYCHFPEPALAYLPPEGDEGIRLKGVAAYHWHPDAHVAFERRFKTVARDAFGMTEIGAGTNTPIEAVHMIGTRTCGLASLDREIKVVDEAGNELPAGETGELWVAGRGILWGYYKNPVVNSDSFRGKWFRTGDLARKDVNGYCYIVGRIKEMIKRSGENISARELESVLRLIPDVEDAAAVAVPDPMRKEEVKVYLLLRGGVTQDVVTPQLVLDHCGKHLARFKWPRYIAYVADFPRTPSRKVAKNRLVADVPDLRAGAFDAVDNIWRH